MRLATRFTLQRFLAIDRAVRAGGYPNARTLADRLEVSRRTIQRDVEFMRERLGASIEYDAARHGYYYADPRRPLGLWDLTEGELVAIFLAERLLNQWRGTPFGPDLERAFQKVVDGLRDTIRVDLDQLAAVYAARTSSEVPFDPAVFQELARAARERRCVRFDYYTASRDDRACRSVDPYALAMVDGCWYMVAFCQLRGDVRMFLPARMTALEVTDRTFDRPESFDLEEYLSASMGVLRGESGVIHRVVLRFTGLAIRYVRERTWHPSQQLIEKPDGCLELTMELSHLREAERWALSWGADCEVIEPPELRERVAAELQRSLRHYASRKAVPPERR